MVREVGSARALCRRRGAGSLRHSTFTSDPDAMAITQEKFGRAIAIMIGVGFAALISVGGASFWLTGKIEETAALAQLAQKIEGATFRVLSSAQDAETGQPFDDAEVNVRITPADVGGRTIHAVATQAAATNKLLRAALMELPSPGSWDVEIAYVADAKPSRQVRFTLEAGRPLTRWVTVWPWFGWPAAVVLLYGVHRWLVGRKLARRIHSQ